MAWISVSRARTRLVRVAILVVVVLAATVLPAEPAEAEAFDAVAIDSATARGTVFAVEPNADVIYLGGSFTQVRTQTGEDRDVSNVAAISRITGDHLEIFDVETDGTVLAIASDGVTTWLGGEFTTVNGQYQPYLVAVDARTGTVQPSFFPEPNRPVRALELAHGRLYAGGSFFRINGQRMRRVASLDPVTGAADFNFWPETDGVVRSLHMSNDGSFLAVGGGFQNIGGQPRRALGLLDPFTGTALPSDFPANLSPVMGVATNADDSRVLVGLGGSSGGPLFGWNNRVASFDIASGNLNWYLHADGDIQAIDFYDDQVYFGFHDSFQGDDSVRMLRADENGVVDPTFRPGVDTRRGVLAIDVSDNGLVAGGKFRNVNGIPQRGVAVFSTEAGGIINPDLVAPTTPTGLVDTRNDGGVVELTWNDDSIDDRFVAGYNVYRDGVLQDTITDIDAIAYQDTGAPAGASVLYEVTAFDSGGNESIAANIVVDTPATF